MGRLVTILFVPLVIATLTGLLAVVFPIRVMHLRATIMTVPVNALSLGLLTAVIFGIVVYLYRLSLVIPFFILLFPMLLLAGLVVLLAAALGWVAVCEIIGRILLAKAGQISEPMLYAMLGAGALSMGGLLLSLVPLFAGIVVLVQFTLLLVGLGASILTRVGQNTYPPIVVIL
jgi:hypothetical protein